MGEPRSWGEFMEALVKLIGQAADTGGSQTEGTVMAKENAALEILAGFQNGTVPIMKSMQYGVATNDNNSMTIPINTINPNKAFVIIDCASSSSNGGVYLARIDANSITISRHMASTDRFSWQVVELY